MNERRKWKNVNTEIGKRTYRKLNNELRRETDRAKEEWWKKECEELEELNRRGRSDLVYGKIGQLTKKNNSSSRNSSIKDSTGKLLTEPEEVRQRWKEYIEVLYDRSGKPKEEDIVMQDEENVSNDCMGPSVLESEIRMAVKKLKANKAVGVDGIPGEFWKLLGEKGMGEVIRLCQEMYEQGVWPEDFTRVVMIPLPKKTNATECSDHRTISLISHASKIMLKVLTKRIEAKARDFIGRSQFGFQKGRGTRDAIGVLRALCERSMEYGNEVYVCFVDFEKAFDRVNWIKMMESLEQLGID